METTGRLKQSGQAAGIKLLLAKEFARLKMPLPKLRPSSHRRSPRSGQRDDEPRVGEEYAAQRESLPGRAPRLLECPLTAFAEFLHLRKLAWGRQA